MANKTALRLARKRVSFETKMPPLGINQSEESDSQHENLNMEDAGCQESKSQESNH